MRVQENTDPNKTAFTVSFDAHSKHGISTGISAIERAKNLFGANWANVQPHSGAQANFAVFLSLLKPGDTIMGMDLSHGGHLTHGSPVNVSGKWFKTCHYEVDKTTEILNMDAIRKKAIENQPKLIICGFSAYPRKIDFQAFRSIADEVKAY